MKILYYLLVLTFLMNLSSCTSYYYSTLNSNDKGIKKTDAGEFVIENDTVLVAYNFYGENAPITICVINKSNQPIYVDWKKSALIIDGKATTYKNNSYSFSEESSSTIPYDTEFIPPRGKTVQTPMELADFSFDRIPNNQYNKKTFCKLTGDIKAVKALDFSKDESPLSFRSYLTIYSEKNPTQPIIFDNEFYISELMKAGNLSPDNFASKQADVFYVKKEKGTKAALIVLWTAGAILEATFLNNYEY